MPLPKPVRPRNLLILILLLSCFTLLAQPSITSFIPTIGPIGTKVIIKGAHFNANAGANVVYFGGVRAVVSAATSTALTVTVPRGASYAPLSVTAGGLTGWSTLPFNPTFGAGGVPFTASSFASAFKQYFTQDVAARAADIDADGLPDIVTATGRYISAGAIRTFSVLRNTSTPSNISWAPDQDFQMSSVANSNTTFCSALADLDGDGSLDIVLSDSVRGELGLSIFRNTSTAASLSFTSQQGFVTNHTGWPPMAIVTRDFDGDGRTDIITADADGNYLSGRGPDSLSVFLNTGTVGSIALQKTSSIPVGHLDEADDITSTDLDGDGRPDLLITSEGGPIYILMNTSTKGHISFSASYAYQGIGYCHLALGDLDGDGRLDIAYIGKDKTVYVMHNTSSKGYVSFSSPQALTYAHKDDSPGYLASLITIGDLDGDGKPEVVTGNPYSTYNISLYRNTSSNGVVSFDKAVDYMIEQGNMVNGLLIQDVDGDGRPELVETNGDETGLSILQNQMATVSKPAMSSFMPSSATAGDTVVITGTNLAGTNYVSFGGLPALSFSVTSPTRITAILDTGSTGNIVIAAPGGVDTITGFTYNTPAKPVITSFTPTQSAQNYYVYIYGRHFFTTRSVMFGGVGATYTILTDTSLSAVVGSGASGYVAVTTMGGTDSLAGFTFLKSPYPPYLRDFYPNSGTAGDTITIEGRLVAVTSVSFGGIQAASFRIVNDSTIKAVIGTMGASGAIAVTSPLGSSSKPNFTFIPPVVEQPLRLLSFFPDSGRAGDTIILRGSSLAGASSVSFGHVAAQSLRILSDSVAAAVVGSGASGEVVVTGSRGLDSLPGFRFISVDSLSTTPPQDSLPVTPPKDSLPPTPPHDSLPPVTRNFQLLHFSGLDTADEVLLLWQSAYDQKIAYYFVRYGTDSSNLSEIGSVRSVRANYSSYSFLDRGRTGTIYYQLMFEDTTGVYTYGPIVTIKAPPAVQSVNIYPNPTTNTLTAAVPVTDNNSWFILTDQSGKVVQAIRVPSGTPQVTMDVSGLIKGLYKLGWSDGHRKSATTVLIVK